jgi:uncharacterized damage-inducible protein DinB
MPLVTPDAVREARRAISAADHPGTIRAHYPFWDAQYRPFTIEAVNAFPPERLDFKPRPDMLTAREMIVHMAEAERAWIVGVLGGGTIEEWVVPAEDPAQGWKLAVDPPDHAGLLALLERWHRPTQEWFDRPAADLAIRATRTWDDGSTRNYTAHWILDHVQEHEIHHRAMLNFYLRLMGLDPPSI